MKQQLSNSTPSRIKGPSVYAVLALFGVVALTPAMAYESKMHVDDRANVMQMSQQQRHAEGIVTARVEQRALQETVIAPGEVKMNAYRTSQVTPRVVAQVVARHAKLGEVVKAGTKLVTLSSVEMAQAQGALIETDREWSRVKRLGRGVVSEKRYVAAQVARQRAYATVRAYGMTTRQIDALVSGRDAGKATGRFDLYSAQDGTIVHDKFLVGEVIKPGRVLFEITDESRLWVEVQLSPKKATNIKLGTAVTVTTRSGVREQGKVVQLHHILDPASRTLAVRVELDRAGQLHPGQYVDVALKTGETAPVIAVPEQAVILLQGNKTVFIVKGDELQPRPIEAGRTLSGWTEIKTGLAAGSKVVVKGVFLLKSLLLKSQIGEGH